MPKEIERKFLIDLQKLNNLDNGITIKQGYISTTNNTVVRIRMADKNAYLTLKGENKGITRTEFEYQIPVKDAEEMITELCNGPVIEKTRYLIPLSKHTWEIDIFHGDNDGLAVAEIELTDENESIDIPEWITIEVSGDEKYYNSNLLNYPFKAWK